MIYNHLQGQIDDPSVLLEVSAVKVGRRQVGDLKVNELETQSEWVLRVVRILCT
jgi:hypothetical protein